MATQTSSEKSRKKIKPEKIGGYNPTQKIGQGAMEIFGFVTILL